MLIVLNNLEFARVEIPGPGKYEYLRSTTKDGKRPLSTHPSNPQNVFGRQKKAKFFEEWITSYCFPK